MELLDPTAIAPVPSDTASCYLILAHGRLVIRANSDLAYNTGLYIELQEGHEGTVINHPERDGLPPEVDTLHFVRRTLLAGMVLTLRNHENVATIIERGVPIALLYFVRMANVNMEVRQVTRVLPPCIWGIPAMAPLHPPLRSIPPAATVHPVFTVSDSDDSRDAGPDPDQQAPADNIRSVPFNRGLLFQVGQGETGYVEIGDRDPEEDPELQQLLDLGNHSDTISIRSQTDNESGRETRMEERGTSTPARSSVGPMESNSPLSTPAPSPGPLAFASSISSAPLSPTAATEDTPYQRLLDSSIGNALRGLEPSSIVVEDPEEAGLSTPEDENPTGRTREWARRFQR